MTKQSELLGRIRSALKNGDDGSVTCALNELIRTGLDGSCIVSLLRMLEDDDSRLDLMFAIVHTVECAPPETVYESVAQELSTLHGRSPQWCELVTARLLAAKRSQGRGYDRSDFLETVRQRADRNARDTLFKIASELCSKGRLDQETAAAVCAIGGE